MKHSNQLINIAFLSLVFVFLAGCNNNQSEKEPVKTSGSTQETEILLQYLEENGNIINDKTIPYFITAPELYTHLRASNYHIIDVRTPREFKRGHIENAVNIQPKNILHYFENKIEPNSFEKIAIVCGNSQLSGYVTLILRLLGYDNTFNLKFGMSSWDQELARRYWWANISNDLVGLLDIKEYPKNEPGKLPAINTGKNSGYEILRARAREALNINWGEVSIDYLELWENPEDYYIVNYWPEALYNMGHLPTAVQYNPKKSLHSTEDIYTLPTNKPIVTYCFTGQNASYVSGFLSVLGYQFKNLDYGANSFMYETLMQTQTNPNKWFQEMHISDFPVSRKHLAPNAGNSGQDTVPTETEESTTVEGGC
ncbi:MAG: rhodanese-like domain-containing protein [Bacteroidales bacterium]